MLALPLMAACQPAVDRAAATHALLERDRAWSRVAEAGKDVDSIVSFWSQDAHVVMPGAPPLVGTAAIRQMVSGSLAAPGFKIAWTPDSAEVSAAGDLGYTWGTTHLNLPDSAGHVVTSEARYLTVWRKEADGQWHCVWDTFNSGPPAAPGA
jgi:ketosteroid isomerase-like protein